MINRLFDSNRLMEECWLRVLEVPGSIPSQGPGHTKDVIKIVICYVIKIVLVGTIVQVHIVVEWKPNYQKEKSTYPTISHEETG